MRAIRSGHCISPSFSVVLLLGLLMLTAPTKADASLEHKLKAAYLINLISFVKWQDDSENTVVCMHPDSSIKPYLMAEQSRVLNNQKKLQAQTSWEHLEHCDVLYWDVALAEVIDKQAVSNLKDSMLTVSDEKGALDDGFAVQFYTRNLKLRFAINNDVITNAEYRISSKLMRLARQLD